MSTGRGAGVSLWRLHSLHFAVVGVVLLLFLLPSLSWPAPAALSLPREDYVVPQSEALREMRLAVRGNRAEVPAREVQVLSLEAVARTEKGHYPQVEPLTYVVQQGDTVSSIALAFNLDQRTLVWANEGLAKSPDSLAIGQSLLVLPVNGAYHTVVEGDTLESIAAKYEVSPDDILAYRGNGITKASQVAVGMNLIIPGAKLPDVPRVVKTPVPARQAEAARYTAPASDQAQSSGTGSFNWPLSGMITQGYSGYHPGIDIHTPAGRPVYAADAGTVTLVSWMQTSYGYHVIIDHGNGVETLYAHLSAIGVEVGQAVGKGDEIGKVGSTGRSTGPHLHFEVRENGSRRNPFNYLP